MAVLRVDTAPLLPLLRSELERCWLGCRLDPGAWLNVFNPPGVADLGCNAIVKQPAI